MRTAEEQDADAELRDHYFVATLTEGRGRRRRGQRICEHLGDGRSKARCSTDSTRRWTEGEQLLAGETWTFEKRIGSWVTPEQEDTIETGSVGYRLIR